MTCELVASAGEGATVCLWALSAETMFVALFTMFLLWMLLLVALVLLLPLVPLRHL